MDKLKIIESSELPLGEKVYLKKDWLGYRVVKPIKDPETGELIWKNLFDMRGFIWLIVLLFILGMLYLGFQEAINNYQQVLSNPCLYCSNSIGGFTG